MTKRMRRRFAVAAMVVGALLALAGVGPESVPGLYSPWLVVVGLVLLLAGWIEFTDRRPPETRARRPYDYARDR